MGVILAACVVCVLVVAIVVMRDLWNPCQKCCASGRFERQNDWGVSSSLVTSLKWPSDFMFGVSTAAFQNEGYNPYSTWSMWANSANVRDAPVQTCDSWHNFEQVDVPNARFLGCNAFRLSLDWARIEPTKGKFNAKALDRYVSMVAALKAQGMEPVLTLVHFALPHWTCGWEDTRPCAVIFRGLFDTLCRHSNHTSSIG